jgi:hypothetical protein
VNSSTKERPEIYRGHLKECLLDLDKRLCAKFPKGSKGASFARKPVADFCGVEVQSIRRWLNPDGEIPTGELLFRLYCYMDMIGYRVIELERTPAVRRQIVELIGFRLVTGDEASAKFGYTQSSSLYQVLQNKSGTTEQRDQAMWEFWKSVRDALEERKATAAKEYSLDFGHKPRSQITKAVGASAPASRSTPAAPSSEATFKGAVSLINSLNSLLDQGWLDNLSHAQLEELRTTSVLRLTVHLNDLSSRILAREIHAKGGE